MGRVYDAMVEIIHCTDLNFYPSCRELGFRCRVSGVSPAAIQICGRSNRRRNKKKRISKHCKKEERILIFEKQLDPGEIKTKKISQGRQDQQDRQDSAAFGRKASHRGKKNPVNPAESPPSVWRVNPVYKNKNRIHSKSFRCPLFCGSPFDRVKFHTSAFTVPF